MTQVDWMPDHCKPPSCWVQIDVSSNGGMVWVATISSCSDHTNLSGALQAITLVNENQLKNNVIGVIQTQLPKSEQTSGTTGNLASGVIIAAAYSGIVPPNAVNNRILHVSGFGVGPNALQLINTRNALNTTFGSGNVIIDSFL